MSRSDYKLEPAESWGRLSLNDWSPQSLPPKKIWHFLYLYTCTPNHQKKVSVEKKTQWVFASPCLTESHNMLLLCYHLVSFVLRPASSIIGPLYERSLSAAFENDHYDSLLIESFSSLPRYFVNSQNIVFVSMFGQLCRAVVSYECGLCVSKQLS